MAPAIATQVTRAKSASLLVALEIAITEDIALKGNANASMAGSALIALSEHAQMIATAMVLVCPITVVAVILVGVATIVVKRCVTIIVINMEFAMEDNAIAILDT
jgi:hypothetical protein